MTKTANLEALLQGYDLNIHQKASAYKEFLKLQSETIDFAIYLTGHDRETIEQMYRDWLKSKTK